MLNIVVDWDGTVTEKDTLSLALQHFVSAAVLEPLTQRVDAALAAGTMTLREVMAAEFRTMTAPLDAVVEYLVKHARIRPGFAEADRVFARDGLARYLDGRGIAYEHFGDFHDIIAALS